MFFYLFQNRWNFGAEEKTEEILKVAELLEVHNQTQSDPGYASLQKENTNKA